MFDIPVPDDVIAHARRLCSETNFGKRGMGDGSPEQQVVGLIGQTMICYLFGLARPAASGGPDGGIDFTFAGLTVDVKTMGRACRPTLDYVNNFVGAQRKYQTDVLLFCSLNQIDSVLTVCGWIAKRDFFQRAAHYPAGAVRTRRDGTTFRAKADLYELPNHELNRPANVEELKADLIHHQKANG